MAVLSPDVHKHCRDTLLKCNEFDDHNLLQTIFRTGELARYRDSLPEAGNKKARVDKTIDYLLQNNLSNGQVLLPLFIATLRDRRYEGDALHNTSTKLYSEVAQSLRYSELSELKLLDDGTRQILKQYFECLKQHIEKWSERYTDLRLTTDIRVGTYKGHRIKMSTQKGIWWFREALNARSDNGKLLHEHVVILGDPGSGKTTVCERATWELAIEGLEALNKEVVPHK